MPCRQVWVFEVPLHQAGLTMLALHVSSCLVGVAMLVLCYCVHFQAPHCLVEPSARFCKASKTGPLGSRALLVCAHSFELMCLLMLHSFDKALPFCSHLIQEITRLAVSCILFLCFRFQTHGYPICSKNNSFLSCACCNDWQVLAGIGVAGSYLIPIHCSLLYLI